MIRCVCEVQEQVKSVAGVSHSNSRRSSTSEQKVAGPKIVETCTITVGCLHKGHIAKSVCVTDTTSDMKSHKSRSVCISKCQ
jgi:hypothetical protein